MGEAVLQAENHQLRESLAAAQREVAELRAKTNALQRAGEVLLVSNERLIGQRETLITENAALRERLEKAEKVFTDILGDGCSPNEDWPDLWMRTVARVEAALTTTAQGDTES